MSSTSPSPSNDPDKPYGSGPRWVFPFILGTGITALGYTFRKSNEAEQIKLLEGKVVALEKANKDLRSTNTTEINLSQTSLKAGDSVFLGIKDAVTALQKGQVTNVVFETTSPDGSFSYLFQGPKTNEFPAVQWILRGMPAGDGRDEFLTQLKESGATVKVGQLSNASAVVPDPATAHREAAPQKAVGPKWYEPFIWPAFLLAGVLILGRMMSKSFKNLSDSMGTSMGLDGRSGLNLWC